MVNKSNYFYKCKSCENLVLNSDLIKSNNDYYCPICGENMHLTINGYVKGTGIGRGGWRGGGRPKGTKKNTGKTEYFTKALTKEEKKYLEKCLIEFREQHK